MHIVQMCLLASAEGAKIESSIHECDPREDPTIATALEIVTNGPVVTFAIRDRVTVVF